MSRRAPATSVRRKSGRSKTLLWIAVMAAIVIGLLYWEKIALLYVLATLGVTALMIVVAMADLAGIKKPLAGTPAPADDSAAIGDGITTAIPSPAKSSATKTARRR
jgi:hypothetical protein